MDAHTSLTNTVTSLYAGNGQTGEGGAMFPVAHLKSSLNVAILGNCQLGALVDGHGRFVWCCYPRFDGDPVFCSLLKKDEATSGFWDFVIQDFDHAEQNYIHNTAVLVTTLWDKQGSAVQITDFIPRFVMHERQFRPMQLFRIITPLKGSPRIAVRCNPLFAYGASVPDITHGSNHIRYVVPGHTVLRLTTNAPVSYILNSIPFLLTEKMAFVMGPDETLQRNPLEVADEFLTKTTHYWQEWVVSLHIPFEWQKQVIRAAIALKLCAYEESGAIVAALTTSIPEAAGSGRNWDYRFCWLRDAYFVVQALNSMGTTHTMVNYLNFIMNIIAAAQGDLQPCYGILQERRLVEYFADPKALEGYRGMGPVRVGNAASEQRQHDIYGAVILAAVQVFFDERITAHQGSDQTRDTRELLFTQLEKLGDKAFALYNVPDAGLWELRTIARVHTFSAVMCWAACDRLAKIADRLGKTQGAEHWAKRAKTIHEEVLAKAWYEQGGFIADAFGGKEIDSSLLLLAELKFISPKDPRYIGTMEEVGRKLKRGQHLFRYIQKDDFGEPENVFNICTFWYIDALHAVGRTEEARKMFENMLSYRNPAGLFSEDLNLHTGELWGNIPQTYSLVGLVNSAMRLSKRWDDAL